MSAIRSVVLQLAIGMALLASVSAFLWLVPPNSCGDDRVVSFLIGIVASIIATLFLKASDKYSEDCATMSKILKQVNSFVDYIDEKSEDGFDYKKCRAELQQRYIDICEMSGPLSYREDYNALSIALARIVRITYAESRMEDFEEAVQSLISARDSMF